MLLRLSYTISSDLASNALVASSNKSIFAFLSTALAIAILYFYPPDIYDPFGPTLLWNPFPKSYYFSSEAFSN